MGLTDLFDVEVRTDTSVGVEELDCVSQVPSTLPVEEGSRESEKTPGFNSALLDCSQPSDLSSRYSTLQVNAVAVLVNLSLKNQNKVKIVRSGIVPPLIDVLKRGFPEARDHAAGALFSLALDDQKKTAIGVLDALPPLLHALRSDSERARQDSALALYHLTLPPKMASSMPIMT
ncbi:U-box domain-containing protein 40 [Camellia lanceoleosa]|uniref:U-box domain-containing protein 40 n=1 Tax=Camellia lanceoleosa TaxID=1840588 RepID=A0ACC0FX42_9ERIC|nr:U-box domain-containing protein 40 [Camellia lanceoleosa]